MQLKKLTFGENFFTYGLYLIFLITTAVTSVGWLQPDEHTRVLEVAHKLVFGYATLPWELDVDHPIVSFLLGAIHAVPLKIVSFFSDDGLVQAAALRAFTAVVCSTRFIALSLILKRLNISEATRRIYLVLMAFGIFGPLLLLRTSQENWATTCLVWALFLLIDQDRKGRDLDAVKPSALWNWSAWRQKSQSDSNPGFWMLVCFALLLTLGTSFRLQLGVTAVGLSLVALRRFGWRRTLPPLVLGVMIGLLPLMAIDIMTVKKPLLPAWNYLQYALSNEGDGQIWGTSPWYWYFIQYFTTWFPPLSPFLLVPLAIGVFSRPVYAFTFVPFLMIHLILAHKEVRYFSPMVPILFLAGFDGWNQLATKKFPFLMRLKSWRKTGRWLLGLSSMVGVIAVLLPLNSSPFIYSKLHDLEVEGQNKDNFTIVRDSQLTVQQFYYKRAAGSPRKIALSEFLDDFKSARAVGWYGIIGIKSDVLMTVEGRCELRYLAVPTWFRAVLAWHPGGVQKSNLSALVYCPKS
ncbi:MAG: hypothetical protein H7249_07195 [Chitinophagaceae bacterium]|nr:hypothetical protein [Oligoflexus sp.]